MMMTKNLLNLVSWQAQSRQGTGQRGLLCSQKVQDGPSQTGRFFFFLALLLVILIYYLNSMTYCFANLSIPLDLWRLPAF